MSARKQRAKRRQCPRKGAGRPKPYATQFQELWAWFLPDDGIFAGLKQHGNRNWLPRGLVCLALCWAWAETRNITDAFEVAAAQSRLLGLVSLQTYQGLMNVLVTWSRPLLELLWRVTQERMQQVGGCFWKIGGFVPLAFDGSRSTAPRTRSAEQAFCAPNYGKGKTARYRKKKTKGMRRRKNAKNKAQPQEPQVWITMLWHMGLRLPWMWRLGPSNSSERQHVMEMLDEGHFPRNTLFCGDAGFVGHPLWSRILEHGHDFLVRVGANVHLLTEMNCVRLTDGRVLSWPSTIRNAGQAPLQLRLVAVKIGSTRMWMLTSVLDPTQLSGAQIAKFYEMRWGIELEFRGLKQTLNRDHLRCRNAKRILVELNWSILAMAVAELFALKEQRTCSGPFDPKKRSLAKTMRALRLCLNNLSVTPSPGRDLCTRLQQALTDDYVRRSSKRARYRPPNPDKKPLGAPNVRPLSPQERDALRVHKNLPKAA